MECQNTVQAWSCVVRFLNACKKMGQDSCNLSFFKNKKQNCSWNVLACPFQV
ncbi:mCG1044285 [Mus musculus]|nr:mCG1044285 [Mus musculus]